MASTSTKGGKMIEPSARDPKQNAYPRKKVIAPNDRTPLMDYQQDISSEALQVLSYLLISSILLTLAGMFLIFFSDDINEVLWESISLIIFGSSATVITVLPGSGPFMVDRCRDLRSSLAVNWRHWSCCGLWRSCFGSANEISQPNA